MGLVNVGGGYAASSSLPFAAMRSQSLQRGIERSSASFGVIRGKFSVRNSRVGGRVM